MSHVIKINNLAIYSSSEAGAFTISWSNSNLSIVISNGSYMQRSNLTGSIGIEFLTGDEWPTGLGARVTIPWYDCSSSEHSRIQWLLGQEVPFGICHFPGTISRVCICSPNVFDDRVAAVVSLWRLTTAGTINSAPPYLLSLARN